MITKIIYRDWRRKLNRSSNNSLEMKFLASLFHHDNFSEMLCTDDTLIYVVLKKGNYYIWGFYITGFRASVWPPYESAKENYLFTAVYFGQHRNVPTLYLWPHLGAKFMTMESTKEMKKAGAFGRSNMSLLGKIDLDNSISANLSNVHGAYSR